MREQNVEKLHPMPVPTTTITPQDVTAYRRQMALVWWQMNHVLLELFILGM